MNEQSGMYDLRMDIDSAHLKILDLSVHLLGYVNAFRAISELPEYLGRRRMRYALILVMLDEMATLMELMKECERAITEHDPQAFIKDFFSDERREEGVENILSEIGKSEILFMKVKKNLGREPSSIDFQAFKDIFKRSGGKVFPMVEDVLRYHWSSAEEEIPSDNDIDMLFLAIELNVRGATDFSYEWAKANELLLPFTLETRYCKQGCDKKLEAGYWVRVSKDDADGNGG